MTLIKTPSDIPSHEITPERVYLSRRQFMGAGVALAGSSLVGSAASAADFNARSLTFQPAPRSGNSGFYTAEALTPFEDAISYNNFYEFGTDKDDPAEYAGALTTDPWSIKCHGEINNPGEYTLEDILARFALEERVYRLRCVEAWSMVVPWVGFPLASLLKFLDPTGNAKYVSFKTLARKSEMKGVRAFTSIIDWPYREGLRLDEAMHPLTLLAVGMYGKAIYPQNGAPIRLVVPWKYGFKSIKSIVGIKLTEREPETSWNMIAPREYGFYANVNPQVSHPRWSQAKERRLPSSLFSPNRIDTQMFNGYGEQVASLYTGMDLARYY